jgi:hypothetical protein
MESWISSYDIRCGQGKVGALMIFAVASPGRSFMGDLVKASTPSWGGDKPLSTRRKCSPRESHSRHLPSWGLRLHDLELCFFWRLELASHCIGPGWSLSVDSSRAALIHTHYAANRRLPAGHGWNCRAHVCWVLTSCGGRRDALAQLAHGVRRRHRRRAGGFMLPRPRLRPSA